MFLRRNFLKLIVLNSLFVVAFGTSSAYALIFGPADFTSYDGTRIDAQLFKPSGYDTQESFPAMVLVPGWSLPKEATYSNALEFARRGFIVMSYTPRGFGSSQGLVNVAGPKDRDDFSAAIDWLLENTKADPWRIGSGGVSYGGLVPTMGASYDERISALAMIDMPADVIDTFYQGDSPNAFWIRFLELMSRTGRPDPIIRQNLDDLFANRRIPEIIAWAEERSPINVIDRINDRQIPVFMSFGYRDRMFRPNSGIRYFEALTGPKRLQLHDGIHGMAAGASDGYRSDSYFDWFDYWLNDKDNGIMERPLADFQIHSTDRRVGYEYWPSPDITTVPLYLSANASRLTGDLLTEPDILGDIWLLSSFTGNQETRQPTTGTPVIDAQTPQFLDFTTLDPDLAHTYQTTLLPEGLKLRGAATVSIDIQAWDEQAQIVAYLYQINPDGQALYLTQGARTFYDLIPGELRTAEIEMTTLVHDFPPGSQLGLAVDTQDPQFVRPPQRRFDLDVIHSAFQPNTLWLPLEGQLVLADTPVEQPADDTATEEGIDNDTADRAVAAGSNASSGGGSGGSTPLWLMTAALLMAWRRRLL